MYYAARYDLMMLSRREIDSLGNPVDGEVSMVALGDGYDTLEQAEEAVRKGNIACESGERIDCTLNNGEHYAGPRYRYELVGD